MYQMTARQHRDEANWIRRQIAEARNNAQAPIADYATATWFDLDAHAALGDVEALAEMRRRHGGTLPRERR